MAILTKTLYTRANSVPVAPPVGMRIGNIFKDYWGNGKPNQILVGSSNTYFADKVIENFDTAIFREVSGNIGNSLFIEPVAPVSSNAGIGMDFNILTSGKKYTIGVGFLQNRDHTSYTGFANSSGSGSYSHSGVINKNQPKYFVMKVTPTGVAELYPNEAGRFNASFVRETTYSAKADSNLIRVRMLLGYTGAEGSEKWKDTLGGYFAPFCYEGETWFDFENIPWKLGSSTYTCEIKYDDKTNLVTEVTSPPAPLGFAINGLSLDVELAEPGSGRTLSNFNSSNYWKFPDGTYKRFANYNSSYGYQESIDMSKYLQAGPSTQALARKGTRPIATLRYSEGGYVASPSSNAIPAAINTYIWIDDDGSVKAGKSLYNASHTIIPASAKAKRVIIVLTAGGSGGTSGHGYTGGGGGGGGGTVAGVFPLDKNYLGSSGGKNHTGIRIARSDRTGMGAWAGSWPGGGPVAQPKNIDSIIYVGTTAAVTAKGGAAHSSTNHAGGSGAHVINNSSLCWNVSGKAGLGGGSGTNSGSFSGFNQEGSSLSFSFKDGGSNEGNRAGGASASGNGGTGASKHNSGGSAPCPSLTISTSSLVAGGGGGGGGGQGGAFGANVGSGGRGSAGTFRIYY